jgi:multicomponent Na+:H+ antiporter subunit E
LKKRLLVIGFLFAIWLLLIGQLSMQELLMGLLVSVLLSGVLSPFFSWVDDVKWSVSLPLFVVQFFKVFFIELVKSNLDMARRVLSPTLPVNPVLVKVKTRLNSNFGRFLLANCITLTPGTLTLDVEGDRLHIHCIDGQKTDLLNPLEVAIERMIK